VRSLRGVNKNFQVQKPIYAFLHKHFKCHLYKAEPAIASGEEVQSRFVLHTSNIPGIID